MHNKTISLLLLSTLAACAVPREGEAFDAKDSGPTAGGSTGSENPGADDPADTAVDDDGDDPADGSGSDDDASGSDGAMAVCGNGEVEGDEVCDDGTNDGEYGGCNPDCLALAPHCGDVVVDDVEVCDDGVNDGRYGGCVAGCQALPAHCGDGTLDPEESCDDANARVNDGCNPDCTTPGELAWSQTWDSFDGATPVSYVATPAGLVFTPDGAVHLAMTETVGGIPTLQNLRIDAQSGEILASHEVVPADGGAYTAMASARHGQSTVIAARRSGSGPQHSALLFMNGDGSLMATTNQANEAAWDTIEGDPDSNRIAVMRNSDSEFVLREYNDGANVFDQTGRGTTSGVAIGYADSSLHMGVRWQLFGPASFAVASWLDNGDVEFGGFWQPTETLETINVHALIDTNDGGSLVVGDYTDNGSPMRSVIAKFSGQPDAFAVWSIYGSDGSSTAASAQDACRTPNGNFIVVGFSQSASQGQQTRVRKLTAAGAEIWDLLLDDGITDRNVITCDDAGGALVTGIAGDHTWVGRFAP